MYVKWLSKQQNIHVIVYYAVIKTYEYDVMLNKMQDMKLYMGYEFNYEKESMLGKYWKAIWENIKWYSLDCEISIFFLG